MRIGKASIAGGAAALATSLLVGLEGYGAKPYLDSAGVLTDCYGNTKQVSYARVRTKAECVQLLQTETGRISEVVLREYSGYNVNELAAVISWTYNVGDGAYRSSTLLKKFKAGQHTAACEEMRRWNLITVAGVKVRLKGLDNRRDQEVALCLKPVITP